MSNRTYRYFHGPVLYPFGFGLSYTRFLVDPAHGSTRRITAGQPLEVSAKVHNTGAVAGTAVVELYVTAPSRPGTPLHALAGSRRVPLQPGQAADVPFSLSPRSFSTVDQQGHRSIGPGVYRIFIGNRQPRPGQGMAIQVVGQKPLDD